MNGLVKPVAYLLCDTILVFLWSTWKRDV